MRGIKAIGVELLKTKIQALGYLPEKPILVTSDGNGGYILVDGAHRLEAAVTLGFTEIPAFSDDTLTDEVGRLQRARAANSASETVIPTTFVDDAELVWRLSDQHTQEQIAGVMRWSRPQVSQYAMLRKITRGAWGIIATTLENIVANNEEGVVAQNATTVAFTEGLLRPILDLTPSQQVELVSALAEGRIQKGTFKSQAEAYKARNEMCDYARKTLTDVDAEFVQRAIVEIEKGAYDKDWKDSQHPKLTKLLDAIREEWERKVGIQIICGDFYEELVPICTSRYLTVK